MIKWLKTKLGLGIKEGIDVVEDIKDLFEKGGDKVGDTLKYKVLSEYSSPVVPNVNDAGIDLKASTNVVVPSKGSAVVPLGIAFDIPQGFFGLLTHRSSLAFNGDCILSLGIIDSSFNGEVKAKVFNMGEEARYISVGERVAQIVIIKYADFMQLKEVKEGLEDGKEGFGSSGVL